LHCRRAKGKAATNRASLEILREVQIVLSWAAEQGWTEAAQSELQKKSFTKF